MNIDEFIEQLNENENHFAYKEPIVKRYFMLSYDESTDLEGDFRYFIAAALHAKGAKNMKSYVATTILFNAPANEFSSEVAITNWRNYIDGLFNEAGTFGQMICMTRQYTNNNKNPVFLTVPYGTIEEEFDRIRQEVIAKF